MRYSGSPMPMGFGEAKQQKNVCLVEFANTKPIVQLIDVPIFQKLERIKGNWNDISNRIIELSANDSMAWLEIIYESEEVIPDLRERLDAIISNSKMEVLRVKNNRIIDRILEQIHDKETLDDLNVHDVFERCLTAHEIPEKQWQELIHTYQETIASLREDDPRAE